MFHIFPKEFQIAFQNRRWNYSNRKWNYFFLIYLIYLTYLIILKSFFAAHGGASLFLLHFPWTKKVLHLTLFHYLLLLFLCRIFLLLQFLNVVFLLTYFFILCTIYWIWFAFLMSVLLSMSATIPTLSFVGSYSRILWPKVWFSVHFVKETCNGFSPCIHTDIYWQIKHTCSRCWPIRGLEIIKDTDT